MNHSHIYQQREHLQQIYEAAVASVHPSTLFAENVAVHNRHLTIKNDSFPINNFKNIYVAGAGKATGAMALETEKIFGLLIKDGVIAVKDDPPSPLRYIRSIIAGHPAPNNASVRAAGELISLAGKMDIDDLLIFLLSGGASSLMTDLPDSVPLHDLNRFYSHLVNSGASIHEINSVRKHLSKIKGGNLVKHCKATIVSLIISDVVDDDLSVIGSGPTSADPTTFTEALYVLEKYNLLQSAPSGVISYLHKGVNQIIPETPKAGDHMFERCYNYILGNNAVALHAAKAKAEALGYHASVLPHLLTGNTEEEAPRFVHDMLRPNSLSKTCVIAGGETTMKVIGTRKGGRNQHFALAAMLSMPEHKNISILAAGTDGSDGPTDAAGAFADLSTLARANELSLHLGEYLCNTDSYNFFEQTGSLFKTGPTHTNVMDIVIGLMWP